jgi:hypothetical protein
MCLCPSPPTPSADMAGQTWGTMSQDKRFMTGSRVGGGGPFEPPMIGERIAHLRQNPSQSIAQLSCPGPTINSGKHLQELISVSSSRKGGSLHWRLHWSQKHTRSGTHTQKRKHRSSYIAPPLFVCPNCLSVNVATLAMTNAAAEVLEVCGE